MTVLGHEVRRREDPAFLTGAARFVADVAAEGAVHAVFVRSPAAHARVLSVDGTAARRSPGVVAVATAADLGLPGLAERPPPPQPRPELERPCLASGRARFVGEPLAVVVAGTAAAAEDAAELVAVDLEDLPAVVGPLAALEEGAPLLFPGHGSNVVGRIVTETGGDPIDGAEVVVRARFVIQRVAPAPLEGNAALAVPGRDGSLVVWASSQAPFRVRDAVCAALGKASDRVRVVAPAVGGGFGSKGGVYPEQVVVAALADRLGRPVRWTETRSENLVAMTHGRGQVQDVELGARRDGTILGLRARVVVDSGAYPWRGGIPARTSHLMATGPYRIPRLDLTTLLVATNTTPLGPYRGAGRPEATAMLERCMDLLAAELGMDPAEVRRRNLLDPAELPYRTPTGAFYDSGDYAGALEEALALAGYDGLRAEQDDRRRRGERRALGIGISCFVEVSGSGAEYGAARVESDGSITVLSGSSPHGQGHETTLAQVAASALGLPMDSVRVVHSDTAAVPRGVGTFGSRSGQLAGSAVQRAAETVLARARELAGDLLEASPEDVVQGDDGRFSVAGVPARSVSWAELAAAGAAGGDGGGLFSEVDFDQHDGTYPFGAHVAVVEVDTETGAAALRRLVAVDDCGVVVNPMIVAGQLHGGLAQGVAQALFEEMRYDTAGNPLTATLADYAFPSAADLPGWTLGEHVTPTPRNPLGAKGVGESGAVGATVAVQNAVVDALRPYGVTHLDLPLSPERVWTALQDAPPPR